MKGANALCFRRGRAIANERGTIAPLVVTAALLLFAVLAFSVDQGIACAAKISQENALDAARDACFDASFALAAKNDDDPGLAVARRVVATLRDEGFAGSVAVWFYEVPKGELPPARRVWGIAVQVREESPTVFAHGFGIASLPVASKRVMVAEPFAGSAVWRPAGAGASLFEAGSGVGEAALAGERLTGLDGCPEEMQREVRAAVEAAGKTKGRERT